MITKQPSRLLTVCAALAAVLVLQGCASNMGSRDYSSRQTRVEQEVRMGVVEGIRDVRIEARETGVGQTAGAVLGGIAGSHANNSRGRGSVAGAVVGAVVGGLVGSSIERSNNERQGIEVTVKLDGGRLIAITQEADEQFRLGDRVRVLSAAGTSRVTREGA